MCGVEPARASVVVSVIGALVRSVSGTVALPHQSTFGKANAPSPTVFRIAAKDQTAGTVAASKNSAWAIAAFTVER